MSNSGRRITITGNRPYSLANFNRLLVVFRTQHGRRLAAGDTIAKRFVCDTLGVGGVSYNQDRAFNQDLGLVQVVDGRSPEEIRITENGMEYLALGGWEQRRARLANCRDEPFNPRRIDRYSGRGGCGTGLTSFNLNFALNNEQREFIFRKLLLADPRDATAPTELRHAVISVMRFAHLEPDHWLPHSNDRRKPEQFTDERIDLFYDTFPIEDARQRPHNSRRGGRYPATLRRNIRGSLEWAANNCVELGLLKLHNEGDWDRASFTELGSRVYQLLEAREYFSMRTQNPPGPTGGEQMYICNGPWPNWKTSIDTQTNTVIWGTEDNTAPARSNYDGMNIGDLAFFSNSTKGDNLEERRRSLGPFGRKVVFGFGRVTEKIRGTAPLWPDEVAEGRVKYPNRFRCSIIQIRMDESQNPVVFHTIRTRRSQRTGNQTEWHQVPFNKGFSPIRNEGNRNLLLAAFNHQPGGLNPPAAEPEPAFIIDPVTWRHVPYADEVESIVNSFA